MFYNSYVIFILLMLNILCYVVPQVVGALSIVNQFVWLLSVWLQFFNLLINHSHDTYLFFNNKISSTLLSNWMHFLSFSVNEVLSKSWLNLMCVYKTQRKYGHKESIVVIGIATFIILFPFSKISSYWLWGGNVVLIFNLWRYRVSSTPWRTKVLWDKKLRVQMFKFHHPIRSQMKIFRSYFFWITEF